MSERPRVLFCGMRTVLEDPAAATQYLCSACHAEWVGKPGDIDCPLCGSDRAVLIAVDEPLTNPHRSPV